jgi:TPR repeat protein
VPQDYKEAVKWYRLAAEQGNADGQTNLGVMYANGQGVPQDFKEAVKWYRLAAEQRHALAQSNLGLMYSKGRGVPQLKAAYALYNLSASIDPSDANKATANRKIIQDQMSSAELDAGQALTREMDRPGNLGKALDAYVAPANKAKGKQG